MNNIKLYKVLYYVCFLVTSIIYILSTSKISYFGIPTAVYFDRILAIVNLILVIIFTIKIFKSKINRITNIFPIIYLLFLIIICILSIFTNNKLIIPYIHYCYYLGFVLFNYVLFNVYTILSLKK